MIYVVSAFDQLHSSTAFECLCSSSVYAMLVFSLSFEPDVMPAAPIHRSSDVSHLIDRSINEERSSLATLHVSARRNFFWGQPSPRGHVSKHDWLDEV
jgi:hypothetical protein